MSRRPSWWRLALLLLSACDRSPPEPEGQILFFVDTDASVSSGDRFGLFDRLELSVARDNEVELCRNCRRVFAVDDRQFREGTVSIGVLAPPGTRPLVRVRLFRSGATDLGVPRPASTLESWVRLPAVEATGVREAFTVLSTEDVGAVVGSSERPIEAEPGSPGPSRVGSWLASRRLPCPVETPADRGCVPGGAYWLGDPQLDLSFRDDLEGESERLVVVSPFVLDATEVTVGALRASGVARTDDDGQPLDPADQRFAEACTFTADVGDREDFPVNCITWQTADHYCASRGGRLPTSAELGWVLGGLAGFDYPWGNDPPERCEDVVAGRTATCADRSDGPEPAGAGQLDRLELDDGRILLDLAGNLAEYAADFWNLDGEGCWAPVGPLLDPRCDTPSENDRIARTLRGSHYADPLVALTPLQSRRRHTSPAQALSIFVGFRCAYAAEP